MLAYEGDCIDKCPKGYSQNSDNTACRAWQLSDLGIVYFPFLVAGLLTTIFVAFGILKTRVVVSKQANLNITKRPAIMRP